MSARADKPISEAQRRAMWAAKSGHSTLGIPQSVGKEFAEKDPGGKLPERKHDAATVIAAQYPNIPKGRSVTKLDECAAAIDAVAARFDAHLAKMDFFGSYGTYGAMDDDRSMNFKAKRPDQSGRQYGHGGRYDDDDISAAGARKAAAALERKGDPYKKDADDHGKDPRGHGALMPSKNDAGRRSSNQRFTQPTLLKAKLDDDRVVHEVLARDRKRD